MSENTDNGGNCNARNGGSHVRDSHEYSCEKKSQQKMTRCIFANFVESRITCIVVSNVGVVGEDSSKHGSVEPGAHDHESHHSRLVAARETDANEADARND